MTREERTDGVTESRTTPAVRTSDPDRVHAGPVGTKPWLPPAFLALLVFVAFWPLRAADFVDFDDLGTIVENPAYAPPTVESFVGHWRRPFMHLYVPLTLSVWHGLAIVSYDPAPPPPSGEAGEKHPRLRHHDAAPFHAANILLHLGTTLTAFALLRRLINGPTDSWAGDASGRDGLPTTWAAFAGAAVVAVHPTQVEPVAWVSGLKDVLSGFLATAAVLAYVRGVSGESPARAEAPARAVRDRPPGLPRSVTTRWVAAATLLTGLATLAKPSAVAVPLLAIVLARVVLRVRAVVLLRTVWPLVLVVIPSIVVTRLVQAPVPQLTTDVPVYYRPLILLDALAFYIGNWVMPFRLAPDYGRNPVWVVERGVLWWSWLVPVALAAGVAAWWWRRPITGRWIAGGLLAAVAAVGPVLGLVRFDFQTYSTVADHYLYPAMPYVGLAVAGVAATTRLARIAWPAGVAVLLGWTGLSFHQARVWQNTETLMTHTAEVNPRSWLAWGNLSAYYIDRNLHDAAEVTARKSLEIYQYSSVLHHNLGVIHFHRGDYAEAARRFEYALRLEPNDARTHNNLSESYGKMGRLDEAVHHLREAVRLEPTLGNLTRRLREVEAYQDRVRREQAQMRGQDAGQDAGQVEASDPQPDPPPISPAGTP